MVQGPDLSVGLEALLCEGVALTVLPRGLLGGLRELNTHRALGTGLGISDVLGRLLGIGAAAPAGTTFTSTPPPAFCCC